MYKLSDIEVETKLEQTGPDKLMTRCKVNYLRSGLKEEIEKFIDEISQVRP